MVEGRAHPVAGTERATEEEYHSASARTGPVCRVYRFLTFLEGQVVDESIVLGTSAIESIETHNRR